MPVVSVNRDKLFEALGREYSESARCRMPPMPLRATAWGGTLVHGSLAGKRKYLPLRWRVAAGAVAGEQRWHTAAAAVERCDYGPTGGVQ